MLSTFAWEIRGASVNLRVPKPLPCQEEEDVHLTQRYKRVERERDVQKVAELKQRADLIVTHQLPAPLPRAVKQRKQTLRGFRAMLKCTV